ALHLDGTQAACQVPKQMSKRRMSGAIDAQTARNGQHDQASLAAVERCAETLPFGSGGQRLAVGDRAEAKALRGVLGLAQFPVVAAAFFDVAELGQLQRVDAWPAQVSVGYQQGAAGFNVLV